MRQPVRIGQAENIRPLAAGRIVGEGRLGRRLFRHRRAGVLVAPVAIAAGNQVGQTPRPPLNDAW